MEEHAFTKTYPVLAVMYPVLKESKETLRGVGHEVCGELIAVSAGSGLAHYASTEAERATTKFRAELVVYCPKCSLDVALEAATHVNPKEGAGCINTVLAVVVVRHPHHSTTRLASGNGGPTDELVLYCPVCDTKPTWAGWPVYYTE